MTVITLDNLDRFLTNLKSMIGSKQDAAPSLTINTTNNTSAYQAASYWSNYSSMITGYEF